MLTVQCTEQELQIIDKVRWLQRGRLSDFNPTSLDRITITRGDELGTVRMELEVTPPKPIERLDLEA